jgi:hypothetical protein
MGSYAVRPLHTRLNLNISRIAFSIAFTRSDVRALCRTDHRHFRSRLQYYRIGPAQKVGGYYSELEVIVKVTYTGGEKVLWPRRAQTFGPPAADYPTFAKNELS